MSNQQRARTVRIRAVLVTYRRENELRSTLSAVARQSRRVDSMLVVDNDPEQSGRGVVDDCGWATYEPTGENLGPAGALSIGLTQLLETAADDDWILLLDDDDPPTDDNEVERLVVLIESVSDTRLGGVGAVGACYRRGRGRIERLPDERLRGLVDVDYIGGGQCPLYRAAAVRQAGVPDASLFFGLDDLEFGLRLRSAGWRLVVDGDDWKRRRQEAGRLGQSVANIRARRARVAWREYYNSRNGILVARRHGTGLATCFATVYGLLRVARSLLRRGEFALVRANLFGVMDGLRGRAGRTMEP